MTNSSPDTSAAEVVAWRVKRYGEYAGGVFGWSDWMLSQLPEIGNLPASDITTVEPLVPKSLLDASRAETAAANARAEALERERDETVLGSMLDIYRQRAEVDADQMAKLEAKLAKAVEALKPFAAMGRQWQTTAKGLVDAETLRAMTYPVDWLAAASTITEIEGKSK